MSWVNHRIPYAHAHEVPTSSSSMNRKDYFSKGERVIAFLVNGGRIEGDFVAILRNQALILKNAVFTNGGSQRLSPKCTYP